MSQDSTTSRHAFGEWLQAVGPEVDAALEAAVAPEALGSLSPRLHQGMAYVLLGGGKRIRPALCLLGAAAEGAVAEQAMPAAVAVEMIHAYSLVHDDLPCMDDDVLRRGKATAHVEFGEATAVLIGDALQALAFETLAAQPDATLVQPQVRLLAAASGAAGMVGGQQLDMDAEGVAPDLDGIQRIHAGKTGALFAASFLLGVVAAGATVEPWRPYAASVGRLFQISDDLLDATRSTEQLGKTAGKDAAAHKATVVEALGLEGARRLMEGEVQCALEAVEECAPKAGREALLDLPVFLGARGA